MAYGQEVSQAPKAQSAMETMLGQAHSLQTMSNDLFNRLERMDTRVHGNHPTSIGQATKTGVNTPQGLRTDLNDTLSTINQNLADCHSKMESLEGFV